LLPCVKALRQHHAKAVQRAVGESRFHRTASGGRVVSFCAARRARNDRHFAIAHDARFGSSAVLKFGSREWIGYGFDHLL
jgi:hypothetical protein